MPNVLLKFNKAQKGELRRDVIAKKAASYMSGGLNRKTAFAKAWSEKDSISELSTKFWTNAKRDEIEKIITSTQKKGKLIGKRDAKKMKHPLEWVAFHLKKAGFQVLDQPKENINYTVEYEIDKVELS